jgi:hypothetical protein
MQRYTEAEWQTIHAGMTPGQLPSQAMRNLMLFLTHSRVWIEQLQLTRVLDAEKGIVGIRDDPIDIEKLMERRILALWNKLTPQNAEAIEKQLESLPLEITHERLRGMCERFVCTLQVNHAYAGVYMRVLTQIEKHGAWKDVDGRRMSEVLLPLVQEKLADFRGADAMARWIGATAGSATEMDPDERFEWEQKWKRNFQALLKMLLYGAVHKMWGEDVWARTQESLVAADAADTDIEAWLLVYQAWRKDGAQGGGRWWRGAKARLTERHRTMNAGRLKFLVDDVLQIL